MTITLESIQFRIPGANNGAFNISVPGLNGGPRTIVTGPEWKRGNTQPAPAALARQAAPPFIDVTFLCSDTGPVPVEIQATAIDGHVLGAIGPQNATFQNGHLTTRILLNAAHFNAVGHTRIGWHWHVTAAQQNYTFDTAHEIYTTIAQPQAPWEPAGTDASAAPWKEALDKACDWANGAIAGEEILNSIANHHYHSGLLKYGCDSYTEGSDETAEEGIFKLDQFLSDQSKGTINQVDCADCATIVALFGGLLGAQCLVMALATHLGVDLKPAVNNVLIGGEAASPDFNHHEVAWSIDDPDTTLVWDFCLGQSVAGQAQPYTDLRFHDPANPATTYPVVAFIPITAGALERGGAELRQIKATAPIFNLSRQIDPTKFDFESWSDRFRDFVGLAFLNIMPVAIGAVMPAETWRYQQQPKPWLVDSVYRLGSETIRIGVFECDSRTDAHLTLYHLLEAQRVKPLLTLRDEPIGDVLFYDSDDKSDLLLFARGNLVVRLQRNRGSQFLLLQLAQIIDNILVHGLAVLRDAASTTSGIISESFPIHLPGLPSLRFFSDTAKIVLSGASASLVDSDSNH